MSSESVKSDELRGRIKTMSSRKSLLKVRFKRKKVLPELCSKSFYLTMSSLVEISSFYSEGRIDLTLNKKKT